MNDIWTILYTILIYTFFFGVESEHSWDPQLSPHCPLLSVIARRCMALFRPSKEGTSPVPTFLQHKAPMAYCWFTSSPPVRWGLLDFMRALLLLFLLFFFFLFFFFFFLLVFADILAVLFARCRQMSRWTSRLQWAAPDLNRELQIAVGSAGPQQRAPDCSGQRRTSTGERTGQRRTSTGLWSGLGNAGPQPGSSGADWATPGLTQGPPERSGQRRTSAARRYVRRCVRNMSEKNVRKNVRRYVKRNVRKYVKRYVRRYVKRYVRKYVKRYVRRYVKRYVRKECQKKCQKKSQKICQKICQKKCQKICQKICQKKCQMICQ